MGTTFIYALCEPRTRVVRYIGKTSAIDRRLKQHLNLSSKAKTHLGAWLRSLSESPVLVRLHEVAKNECWSEEERRYISCARALGIDLVNITDGGEGGSYPKSPCHCAAISASMKGRSLSPEHCAAMSAATMGVPKGPFSPEHCAAISAATRGVPKGPRSPETRAAISATLKGVPKGPRSPEHCAAISASQKGVPWTPERRAAHEARKAAK